jgi:acetolactate synthase I/II/III large subunit
VATETGTQLHGGRLIAERLRAHGVEKLFTLSGGHLFSIYDGCREEGIELVDVRHEQTAAFAAEGWAKVTRTPGVCALTAGPGVTNGMSAIASASQNHSPLVVLGGRAPQMRWGQGSLQEIDHVPFVRPLTKLAATPAATGEIPALVDEALRVALTPYSGPAFVDFPLDYVFGTADSPEQGGPGLPSPWRGPFGGDERALTRAAELLRGAERPVIMAGTDLYWGHGEDGLRALAEEHRVPVFLNGLGRGCLPADHELFFSRARSAGLGGADVALVIGVPLDFRLGFGAAFAPECEIIVLDVAEPQRDHPRAIAAELYGPLPATLEALRAGASPGPGAGGDAGSGGAGAGSGGAGASSERSEWVTSLRGIERSRRADEAEGLSDPRAPLHPMRIYGELSKVLDRDAIVVGDGGDFVSFAGRLIDSYEPGCWLDPGPFGCLGSGPGYALAAKLAHPERQVVLLLGDGAFGFAGMEWDTLARHGVAVVGVIGNNGIWALEKHPMEFLYGYSVAADLRPGTRYDQVAEALGCRGELVSAPDDLRPALERALEAGEPTVVNVLTDPSVAYPRKSNLA